MEESLWPRSPAVILARRASGAERLEMFDAELENNDLRGNVNARFLTTLCADVHYQSPYLKTCVGARKSSLRIGS
jgi:hypothetical protein